MNIFELVEEALLQDLASYDHNSLRDNIKNPRDYIRLQVEMSKVFDTQIQLLQNIFSNINTGYLTSVTPLYSAGFQRIE